MNKTMKSYLLAGLLALAAASMARASKEVAVVDGGTGKSGLGAVVVSTKTRTAPAVLETRNIRTTDNGYQLTASPSSKSSFIAAIKPQNSTQTVNNLVSYSTDSAFSEAGSTSNVNVYAVAVPSNPILGLRLQLGPDWAAERLAIFDCRGDTTHALARPIWNSIHTTTGSVPNQQAAPLELKFNVPLSSGLTVMKYSSGTLYLEWLDPRSVTQ